MKNTKNLRNFKYLFITFSISILSLIFISCSNWIVPVDLTGKWVSQQDVVFRDKKEGKYVFTKHSERIEIWISSDGKVTGNIGNAVLKDCKIIKNRGAFGRFLNLKTDYQIIGKLEGKINPKDVRDFRKVSMPFNMKNNAMEGSIFESSGFNIFPFGDMNLTKSSQ